MQALQTKRMKNVKWFWILLASSFCGWAYSQDSNDCLIWVQNELPSLSLDHPKFYEYSFEWKQLPAKVSWNPDREKLPIDLSSEAIRARGFLEAKITNQITLQRIHIERLDFPAEIWTNHQGDLVATTNQWFVVFTFSTSESEERSAVLLLDGEYAQEKPGIGKQREPLTGLFLGKTISKVEPEIKKRHYKPSVSPLAKLDDPHFEIPAIQWPSIESPFPLDIGSATLRSKDFLSKAEGIDEKGLQLTSIWFSRYSPDAAIKEKRLKLMDNFHHWIATFFYTNLSGDIFQVPVLLDGTILGEELLKPQ
jgi:hypothetical protein